MQLQEQKIKLPEQIVIGLRMRGYTVQQSFLVNGKEIKDRSHWGREQIKSTLHAMQVKD